MACAGVLLIGLAPAASAVAQSDDFVVEAKDNFFEPEAIQVEVGGTITWENTGQLLHTAQAADDSWDSGDLDPGESFSVTFDEAGTVPYICLYHEVIGMVGTIEVVEAGAAPDGGTEQESSAGAPEEETEQETEMTEVVAASSEEGPTHLGPIVLVAIGSLVGLAMIGAGFRQGEV